MARVNKTTKSVFADLVGSAEKFSAYDIFLDSNNPEKPSSILKRLMKDYRAYINAERTKLERIALIEEMIMQFRSKENITDIKLMIVRDYIYARCPFFRKDVNTKDVRVLVCPISDLNLEDKQLDFSSQRVQKTLVLKLYNDDTFMTMVKKKISDKMEEVIQKNEERLVMMTEAVNVEEPIEA
jgi:hypothetical protein